MSSNSHPRRQLWRVSVFLFGAILLFTGLSVVYQAIVTLRRLEVVEAERDGWQRPEDVIKALGLSEGNTAVDLGSGAGYFALKLSHAVGRRGEVIAVDIRKLPLVFLRIRALQQRLWNIKVVRAAANDPQLPTGTVDAILIANTYHELSDRDIILTRAHRALRAGGRLVIVDRGPAEAGEVSAIDMHHDAPMAIAEANLLDHGFELKDRVDRFIDRPDEPWWLVVAQKRDP